MRAYKSIEEVIELYKKAKATYHRQWDNLVKANISDRESYVMNVYNELHEYGQMLERNGIDIAKLNAEYELENNRKV